MKIALLAATALVSSTFITMPALAGPVTPPSANAPDGTTEAAMQAQCDALAALRGPADGPDDIYSAEVLSRQRLVAFDGISVEVGGSRNIDVGSITPGTGTYVLAALEIRGNPFKTGWQRQHVRRPVVDPRAIIRTAPTTSRRISTRPLPMRSAAR